MLNDVVTSLFLILSSFYHRMVSQKAAMPWRYRSEQVLIISLSHKLTPDVSDCGHTHVGPNGQTQVESALRLSFAIKFAATKKQ